MTSYFNSAIPLFPDSLPIESAISQLQLTSAVAPFIQTANHVVTFATSDPPGPGSDHNLLVNTPVVIDPNIGDMSAVNSISFNSVAADPAAGSLWLNQSNNHLMHGAVDLETGGGGGVSTTGAPVTGNSIPRFDGTSGNFIEESPIVANPVTTQFYLPGGPQISALGINLPNPAGVTTSAYLEHYSTNFLVTPYTGPYLVPSGNVLLLLQRIGNIVHLTIASAVSGTGDAAAPAAIVTSLPLPIGYRPAIATKVGTLGVQDNNTYQMGSWYIDTAGILTVRPTLDPTSQFSAPVAGTDSIIPFTTLTYTIQN